MIRAVLFDLGGVVFHYQPELRWRAFAELGGFEPDLVRKRLSDSGYAMSCDSGALRGERACAEGIRLLGSRLSMERFREIWVSAFKPDREVLMIVRKLKPRCATALLSNNSDMVKTGLEARYSDALALFLPRVFSADVGICKPDPRIFTRTLDLMGFDAAETLLVDDASKNTDTAASLGFHTHTFSSAAGLQDDLARRELL